jgi:hypothetical protein
MSHDDTATLFHVLLPAESSAQGARRRKPGAESSARKARGGELGAESSLGAQSSALSAAPAGANAK